MKFRNGFGRAKSTGKVLVRWDTHFVWAARDDRKICGDRGKAVAVQENTRLSYRVLDNIYMFVAMPAEFMRAGLVASGFSASGLGDNIALVG